jgi:hypothetical protein
MYLFELISGSILLALIFHDAFEVMLLPDECAASFALSRYCFGTHGIYGRGLPRGWHWAFAAICF